MYANDNSELMLGRYINDAGMRDKAVIATEFS